MKAYKAINEDMRATHGDGMIYELGKMYIMEGPLEPGRKGFHYCEKLDDVIAFYDDIENSRYFEVEVTGKIKKRMDNFIDICATDSIILTTELSKEYVTGFFKQKAGELSLSENYDVRAAIAKMGLYLDRLICDKHPYVSEIAMCKLGIL